MPMRNNKRYCVTHQDQELTKNEKFNALTKVEKNGKNITFNPSSGVPLRLYYCSICGYVELYLAATDKEWQNS